MEGEGLVHSGNPPRGGVERGGVSFHCSLTVMVLLGSLPLPLNFRE